MLSCCWVGREASGYAKLMTIILNRPRNTGRIPSKLFQQQSKHQTIPTDKLCHPNLILPSLSESNIQLMESSKETILPIKQYESQIISSINSNPVTIICGETGCGKTTQVPQYIIQNIPNSKVIVTQPRRIAAISVAERVAYQLKTKVGGLVGHHIGMDNQVSNATRISYVTTGILLEKLTNDPKFLESYTHVIFDEVHERGIECDFSLIAIKLDLCLRVRKHLRVIVMSATLNSSLFSNFFAQTQSGGFVKKTIKINVNKMPQRRGDRRDRRNSGSDEQTIEIKVLGGSPTDKPAHCIMLPTLRKFTITIKYLDSIMQNAPSLGSYPMFESSRINQAVKLCRENTKYGDILIFVPGMREIKMMSTAIAESKLECRIFELHSHFNTSTAELFAKSSLPKIIISTNIAESSITIPNIKCIIDFCLSKQSYYNGETNFQRLELRLASQASMIQRAGRVGRVSDGVVFRLIHEQEFEDAPEHDQPEMTRSSLQKTILRIKKLDALSSQSEFRVFKDIFEVLSNAFEAPDIKKIDNTIQKLVFQEALIVESLPTESYPTLKHYGANLVISELGRYVVEMPCDIHLAKMLILASAIGVHEQMIDIVAIICYKKAFFVPFDKRINHEKYIHTLSHYDNSKFSDFGARQRIFDDWLNNYFFPWKRENYKKFEVSMKETQEAKDDEEIYFSKFKGVYIDNSKLVNSFIAEKIDPKQIEWCTNRCVFSNNFREILSLRESIEGKVNRKLNLYKQNSNYDVYIENLLEIICLFCGFKNNLIEIELEKKSVERIALDAEDDLDETVLLRNAEFTQNQLEKFILDPEDRNPHLKIHQSNNNYRVTGSLKYLAKLCLPFKTRKTLIPKDVSKVFGYLSMNKPIYQYIFLMRQKRNHRNANIDDESINKAQFYSGDFQGYLLTNEFIQTVGGLIAKSTAWISSTHAALLQLIFSKEMKLVWNKTEQFYASMNIGKTNYSLPFFLTKQLLQIIHKARQSVKRLFFIDKQKNIDSKDLIDTLIYLMDNCELIKPIPVVQKWEELYAQQKGFNTRKQKYSESFDNIRSVSTIPSNYYDQYKSWKNRVMQKLDDDINQFRYDKMIFACKECLPLQTTIVCPFDNVNKEKRILVQKESTSEWIVEGDNLHCRSKRSHYLGEIVDNVPKIDCQKMLMLRYPNGDFKNTSLEEMDFELLARQESQMKRVVLEKQKKERTYECVVCYDDRSEYIEENYKNFRKHYLSEKHRERAKRFTIFF